MVDQLSVKARLVQLTISRDELMEVSLYVAITILKLFKQKNEYLKEIRDEWKKNNRANQL